jgi:hypothetical protein
MKIKGLLIVLLVFYLLPGCKKENTKPAPPTLVANWNIVSDYTANHLAQTNTYTGVAGDYFDFRTDGKCYVKEGSRYDTLSYAITSDTTLHIQSFGYGNAAYYADKANPLTTHTATLSSTGPYVPAEVDYRQVKLSR